MIRTVLALVLGVLLAGAPLDAQLAEEFSTPRPANCCLANSAMALAEQLLDWNQLGRYYQANKELRAQPRDPNRVVFIGDSITDGWRLAEAFPGKPYVNRGISGQTTAQMLVRTYHESQTKPVYRVREIVEFPAAGRGPELTMLRGRTAPPP